MSPKRIQLRRLKGWRMPDGAVSVARPSRWGNPWMIGLVVDRSISGVQHGAGAGMYAPDDVRMFELLEPEAPLSASEAVRLYRHDLEATLGEPDDYPDVVEALGKLRGKDLACWCSLDQPCHADVLLELANAEDPA
ncbi:MAG TPA: DUF4326 domain-containing protein [Acidimicrobiales bacterium]|nr:DUF4326 domain-containing protein [Acidimicrobiales bacterium]